MKTRQQNLWVITAFATFISGGTTPISESAVKLFASAGKQTRVRS